MARLTAVVVVVCCGLPSAGKTTFCERLKKDTDGKLRVVHHVCFDEYYRTEVKGRDAVTQAGGNEGERAEETPGNRPEEETREVEGGRNEGGKSDERGLDKSAFNEGTLEAWHTSRGKAFAAVEALIIKSLHEQEISSFPHSCRAGPATATPSTTQQSALSVILVDDNMHFRSMRRRVLQLAQKYCCGYAQLYFEVAEKEALERDERRAPGHRVGQQVIRKMASSFQPPQPERLRWEIHTLVVRGGSGSLDSVNSAGTLLPYSKRSLPDEGRQQTLSSVLLLIDAAARQPEQPTEELSELMVEERESEREATARSEAHRLDLELRKEVQCVMRQLKAQGAGREMLIKAGRVCAESRTNTLQAWKTHQQQHHQPQQLVVHQQLVIQQQQREGEPELQQEEEQQHLERRWDDTVDTSDGGGDATGSGGGGCSPASRLPPPPPAAAGAAAAAAAAAVSTTAVSTTAAASADSPLVHFRGEVVHALEWRSNPWGMDVVTAHLRTATSAVNVTDS